MIMSGRLLHYILNCIIIFLCIHCDSENAFACLQTDGNIVNIQLELPPFSQIQVEDDISIELRQGDVQEVILETGENLVSDLNIFVQDGRLIAQNSNSCNLFRDFGVTLLRITSPNITAIRHASAFEVRSIGVLNYPSLNLRSDTTGDLDNPNNVGDFILDLNSESVAIIANGMGRYFLSGQTENANFFFTDEFPLLEAESLIVQNLIVRQVSSAPMRVHPIQSITGFIRGVGDVIAVNRPPIVEVDEQFEGRLIFD